MNEPSYGGLVLAAGASRRMGSAKALLKTPGGVPLGMHQAALLQQVGCAPVGMVVGSDGAVVAEHLAFEPVWINNVWKSGRTSSVQCGIRNMPGLEGYIILPVDTAGVGRKTLETLRDAASENQPKAVRLTYRGQVGHLAWISAALADAFMQVESTEELRLNERIDPVALRIEVEDPAILHNVNTPEDWELAKRWMESM